MPGNDALQVLENYPDSHFRNDEGLRELVKAFKRAIGERNLWGAEDEALNIVQELAQGDDPYFTEDNVKILQKARGGDFEAAARLIRANPEVLILPSIQMAVVNFLNEYKHTTKTGTLDIKSKLLSLVEIRGQDRKSPYPHDTIKGAVEAAKKDGLSKTKAIAAVAERFNISEGFIKKVLSE